MKARNTPIALAIAIAIMFTPAAAQPPPDPAYSPDAVAVARLCANEASLRRGDDCAPIAAVVLYQATRRRMAPADYVAAYHRRHTRNPSRPWIAELSPDLQRPPSWPEDRAPWAARVGAWRGLLDTATAVLAGERGHGCDGVPLTWGGPAVDRLRIDRMTRSGRWRVLRCGRTANLFLGRP